MHAGPVARVWDGGNLNVRVQESLMYTKHNPSKVVIDLEKIDEAVNGAISFHMSSPGKTSTQGSTATCESRTDELFLDVS